MSFETVEQRIAAEYSVVKGWIALHPYWAVGCALVAGVGLGWLF